jgi:hypothetical protein
MISKVSLPAMNFNSSVTAHAAPLHQDAGPAHQRTTDSAIRALPMNRFDTHTATAIPKLTTKQGFISAPAASNVARGRASSAPARARSDRTHDFVGLVKPNAGRALRDGTGGPVKPSGITSVLNNIDPVESSFGTALSNSIGGYVNTSPATRQLRSTPAAQHGVQLHDAVNHRLQNSTDVLLSGIAPLQGTPRELAVKDMLNNTQPIAGTRSESAMKDMLNGIEPVQQTVASLLNGIEPVKPSVTRLLDSIGPMKPTTTSLLDGVRDSWKQRLLPTDKTRLAAGDALRSNLRGEASMEFVRNLSPFAPLGNNRVATNTQSLPQAAATANPAKLGVAQLVALQDPVSLDRAGVGAARKNVGSAKPTAEGNSQPVSFFRTVSAMKQPAPAQPASSYSRQAGKDADPERSAAIDADVYASEGEYDDNNPGLAVPLNIQRAEEVINRIDSGEPVSAATRDYREYLLRSYVYANPHMTPEQVNHAADLADQLRQRQDVNLPFGPVGPNEVVGE